MLLLRRLKICQVPSSKLRDARGRPCYVSHLFGLVTLDVAPFLSIGTNPKGRYSCGRDGTWKDNRDDLTDYPPQAYIATDTNGV